MHILEALAKLDRVAEHMRIDSSNDLSLDVKERKGLGIAATRLKISLSEIYREIDKQSSKK